MIDCGTWLESTVIEKKELIRKSREAGQKINLGDLLTLCSVKHWETPSLPSHGLGPSIDEMPHGRSRVPTLPKPAHSSISSRSAASRSVYESISVFRKATTDSEGNTVMKMDNPLDTDDGDTLQEPEEENAVN